MIQSKHQLEKQEEIKQYDEDIIEVEIDTICNRALEHYIEP
jgi:hypothetical protein